MLFQSPSLWYFLTKPKLTQLTCSGRDKDMLLFFLLWRSQKFLSEYKNINILLFCELFRDMVLLVFIPFEPDFTAQIKSI